MTDFLELDPASDNCQRWREHEHSWRRTSEGGFDPARYTVEPIEVAEAKSFILTHHYSAAYPADKFRFGMFDGTDLVGVLVYSVPAQQSVLTNVFPKLEPYVESVELGRLVLLDEVPAPAESWFIARCGEEAAARGVAGVVSFSDPVPRVANGRTIMPGHVGTIYQASNATYLGRATARTLTMLPDGSVLNDRSVQKVRGRERGHEHVERKLVELGAPPMRAGADSRLWLREALDAIGVQRVRHRGNHRYAFALGTKSQRRRLCIAGDRFPYPKEADVA